MTEFTTIISVQVLSSTAETLKRIGEQSGLTTGDLIDKLALNYEAQTKESVAQQILTDMITYTNGLTQRQVEEVFYSVVSAINDSLVEGNVSKSFKEAVDASKLALESKKRH